MKSDPERELYLAAQSYVFAINHGSDIEIEDGKHNLRLAALKYTASIAVAEMLSERGNF